jgi:hypothetical protein
MNKKLSFSIRIDNISPSHVHCSLFAAMILEEYDHAQATRAKAGDFVLTVAEFIPFIAHIKPPMILLSETIKDLDTPIAEYIINHSNYCVSGI